MADHYYHKKAKCSGPFHDNVSLLYDITITSSLHSAFLKELLQTDARLTMEEHFPLQETWRFMV